MALTQRQANILEYLRKNKYAKISELAKELFVSDATIRRELTEMKKLGLLERTHGGAAILETSDEVAVHVRYEHNMEDKRKTTVIALNQLPEFKSAFIDNSSTALILAQQMDLQYKTVVTNGLMLAMELTRKENITVLMPGGNLNFNSNSLTGSFTLRCLENMHFGLMLCSCTALSADGTFENSLEQSELKRMVLRNSSRKILLVDKAKFNGNAMHKTADLFEYDTIFTNADDDVIKPYAAMKGVHIINK